MKNGTWVRCGDKRVAAVRQGGRLVAYNGVDDNGKPIPCLDGQKLIDAAIKAAPEAKAKVAQGGKRGLAS